MRVDKILYQKIFPTGMAYLNHKIGVEIQVDENDDWQEAFEMAKRMVEQWNKESNPAMAATVEYYNSQKPEHPNSIDYKKEEQEERIKALVATIEYIDKPSLLKGFKKNVDSETDPRVKEAYDKKLKELSI